MPLLSNVELKTLLLVLMISDRRAVAHVHYREARIQISVHKKKGKTSRGLFYLVNYSPLANKDSGYLQSAESRGENCQFLDKKLFKKATSTYGKVLLDGADSNLRFPRSEGVRSATRTPQMSPRPDRRLT